MKREFLDPEYETDITVREIPLALDGGVESRRLKCWVFQNKETGEEICRLTVHRTENLGILSEIELEAVYLLALDSE